MKKVILMAVLAAGMVVLSAQEAEASLLFKGGLGGGYSLTSTSDLGVDVSISGPGMSMYAMGGVMLLDTLEAHLAFSFNAVPSPEVEVGPWSGTADDSWLYTGLFGGGVSLYLGDAYFGATLGFSILKSEDSNGNEYSSNLGFGAEAFAGYDFWLLDTVGIGIMARFDYLYNIDSDNSDVAWGTIDAGLLGTVSLKLL